jgi:asparagine synthase (glutamine-hydrolysing)
MCGIGGYQLNLPPDFDVNYLLGTIQQVQHHRGPDSRGYWVDQQCINGLCHNRLAIVDLSELGKQPMETPDGRHIISFNGEIYNWRDLRSELEASGISFRSHTDTEVLLQGYRKWGESVLQKLRGMFAFAIWDASERTLFCARDRVGKKPFVYGETNKGFFFASEIPALVAVSSIAKFDLQQDDSALASMLLHNLRHIPDPATAYKGLRKLRAGHALIVMNGRIKREWRYWSPEQKQIRHADELRAILEGAVAVRSVSDVPVGALLSGGVDSTAIVNLMQQNSTTPIRTYAFGAEKDDEDLKRARLVSKHLGTNHKEFYFNPGQQYEVLRKIIGTYGEPIMLLPLIHAYELSEAIRDDNIKVVLNGNGADELFYGYTGHIRTAYVTRLINTITWLKPALSGLHHPALSVLMANPGQRKSAMYQQKAEKCWPSVCQDEKYHELENLVSREMEYWGDVLPCRNFIDESNYLSLLIENTHSLTTASDLPAMMASVEMRAPFLDQEVISAAMGIHFSQKVRGPRDGSGLKHILRKAVSDLVPTSVLNAPKRGFGMGIQERDLLLGPWRRNVDEVLNDFPEMELFDCRKIRALWRDVKEREAGDWSLLAKLFSIGLWKSEVMK